MRKKQDIMWEQSTLFLECTKEYWSQNTDKDRDSKNYRTGK